MRSPTGARTTSRNRQATTTARKAVTMDVAQLWEAKMKSGLTSIVAVLLIMFLALGAYYLVSEIPDNIASGVSKEFRYDNPRNRLTPILIRCIDSYHGRTAIENSRLSSEYYNSFRPEVTRQNVERIARSNLGSLAAESSNGGPQSAEGDVEASYTYATVRELYASIRSQFGCDVELGKPEID